MHVACSGDAESIVVSFLNAALHAVANIYVNVPRNNCPVIEQVQGFSGIPADAEPTQGGHWDRADLYLVAWYFPQALQLLSRILIYGETS